MGQYILKRLLLIIPTLLLILLTNFVIIQSAPGGPVEQKIAQIEEAQKLKTAAASLRPQRNFIGKEQAE